MEAAGLLRLRVVELGLRVLGIPAQEQEETHDYGPLLPEPDAQETTPPKEQKTANQTKRQKGPTKETSTLGHAA